MDQLMFRWWLVVLILYWKICYSAFLPFFSFQSQILWVFGPKLQVRGGITGWNHILAYGTIWRCLGDKYKASCQKLGIFGEKKTLTWAKNKMAIFGPKSVYFWIYKIQSSSVTFGKWCATAKLVMPQPSFTCHFEEEG